MASNTALLPHSTPSYSPVGPSQPGPAMNVAGPSSAGPVDNGYVTHRDRLEYQLIVRQEPKQARMCGVGGKADRRPIDPPPIVQLRVIDPLAPPRPTNPRRSSSPGRKQKRKARRDGDEEGDDRDRHRAGSSTPPPQNPPSNPAYYRERASAPDPDRDRDDEDYRDARDNEYPHDAAGYAQSYLQNPYYFMFASLAKPHEDQELHWLKDGRTRCTTGSVVSSLYHLKDPQNNNEDAGFFVFPDLSVRTEGSYRLKLSLYEVVGNNVRHCKSIYSAPFYVYTAKKFPGMEESTPLSCALADQGIKIRIRKDIRVRKRPLAAPGTPTGLLPPGEPSGQGNDNMEVDEARGREKRARSRERDDDRRRQRSTSKGRERSPDRRNNSPTPTVGGSETPRRAAKRSRTDDGSMHVQSPSQSSIPPPTPILSIPAGDSNKNGGPSGLGGIPIGPAEPIPVPQQHPWPPIPPLDPNLGPAIPPPPGVGGGSQRETPQPETNAAAQQTTPSQTVIPPPPGATGVQTPPQPIQAPAPQMQQQQQQQHQPQPQQANYGTVDPTAGSGYGTYQHQTHTPTGYEGHQQPQYPQQSQQYAPAPTPTYPVHNHGHAVPGPPTHGPPPPLAHQHSGYAPPPPPQAPYAGQPQVNQGWAPPPPAPHQPNQHQAPPQPGAPRYDYAPTPNQGVPVPPPSQTPLHGHGGTYAPPPPPPAAHPQVQQYPPQQQVYQQPPQPYYDAYGQPQYLPFQPQQQPQQYQQPQYPQYQPPPPPHAQYQQGVQTPAQGTYAPNGPPPSGHYPHPSQPQPYQQQNAPPATHYQYYDNNGYAGNGNPPASAPNNASAGTNDASATSNRNMSGNGTNTPPQAQAQQAQAQANSGAPANTTQSPGNNYAPQPSQPPAATSTPNEPAAGNNNVYNNNGYYAPPPPQHQQYQQYPPQQQYPYPQQPQQPQQPHYPPPPQQYPQQRQQAHQYAPPANGYPAGAVGYGGYPSQPQQQQPPPPQPPMAGQYPQHHQQPPQQQQQQAADPWGTPPVATAYGGAHANTGSWDYSAQPQPNQQQAAVAPNASGGHSADRIQLAPLRTGAALDSSPSPVVGSAATSAGTPGAQGGYGVMPISRSSRDNSAGGAAYGYTSQGHPGAAMSSLRDDRWAASERGPEGGREYGRDPQRDSRGSISSIGGRDGHGGAEERVAAVSERARERERSTSINLKGSGKRNPLSIGSIISDA